MNEDQGIIDLLGDDSGEVFGHGTAAFNVLTKVAKADVLHSNVELTGHLFVFFIVDDIRLGIVSIKDSGVVSREPEINLRSNLHVSVAP